jgi:hypothetical protein
VPNATLPETVTVPVEVLLDAAAHMQAVDEVMDVLNRYETGSSTPWGFAANRLVRAALGPEDPEEEDVDDRVMDEFTGRAAEIAAGWLEAVVTTRVVIRRYGIALGKLLDIGSYDVETVRGWAERGQTSCVT